MANTRQVAITQDHTKLSADVTYFPWLLTEAQMPDELIGYGGAYQSSDGACLRFYENSNQTSELAREVVSWSVESGSSAGDQLAEVWVAGSGFVLSSSSDTTIYMEYGDNALSDYADGDTYGANNVYDSNTVAALHLEEAVNTTTDGYKDSSGGGNHGTGVSMAISESAAQIGNGQTTDGSADYIKLKQNTNLPLHDNLSGGITVSLWLSFSGTQADKRYFAEANTGNDVPLYTFGTTNAGSKIYCYGRNNSNVTDIDQTAGGGTTKVDSTTTGLNDGALHQHTWVDDNGGLALYLDGSADASDFSYTPTGTYSLNTTVIGGILRTSFITPLAAQFDELRLSKTARAASWIAAEYANQNSPSTFASAGTPGSIGGGGSHPIARTFVGPFGSPLKGVLQ